MRAHIYKYIAGFTLVQCSVLLLFLLAIGGCVFAPPPKVALSSHLKSLQKEQWSYSLQGISRTDSTQGYLLFTPNWAEGPKDKLPLIVYLHGKDAGQHTNNPEMDVKKLFSTKLIQMLVEDKWLPPFPAVILAPHNSDHEWKDKESLKKLRQLIQKISHQQRCDTSRTYMTGISMGGFGVFAYLAEFSDDPGIAAAVPIAGGGNPEELNEIRTPIWAFHGAKDPIIPMEESRKIINEIREQKGHAPARLTVFPEVGHDSWTPVYTKSGMGQESWNFTPFDEDIFMWMYRYQLQEAPKE